MIGRLICADSMTESCTRLSYANICVEIEVDSELPSSFDFRFANGDSVVIGVKYPWRPLRCGKCRAFGHDEAHCVGDVQVQEQA